MTTNYSLCSLGYLPTQRVLGDGVRSEPLKEPVPFFEETISMIRVAEADQILLSIQR
jgi:hypothetical protein